MSKKKQEWKYRLVFELDPKLKEADRDGLFDAIEEAGEKFTFVFDRPVSLGVKELAYKINGFNKSEMWNMRFMVESSAKMDSFNVFLNRENKIMRYLILKI